jgi:hypothetical protein
MNNVSSLQSNSALAQLLAIQKSTQASVPQPSQSNTAQPAGTDSLSISAAALQALQGLGQNSTQNQLDQALATYKAHGHHRHHHGGVPAPKVASTQQESTSQNIQVASTDQASSSSFQAKG